MTSPTTPPPQDAPACRSCSAPLPSDPRIGALEKALKQAETKLSAYETRQQHLSTSSGGTLTSHPSSPATRVSSFLFPSAARRPGGPPSPPPDNELARERSLRLQAEERLHQVTNELEDLSASLFQSANEMVAEERRARSKLEERVVVLERREAEKRERLGVLERAVDRISRVREMLAAGGGVEN